MNDTGAAIDPAELKAIQDKLEAFANRRPLMERIGRVMKTDVQMNFRKGQTPDGQRWAPLKIRTGQPLRLTRRLMSSYDFEANDDEVVVGTNYTKVALTHHFGATIKAKPGKRLRFQGPGGWIFAKKVTIPARPALGLGPVQVQKINRAIEQWAEDTAND